MKKLFVVTAMLAAACVATWAPSAEAVGYCSATYCAGKPATATCGCPPHTDRPGRTVFCGNWNTVGACWYG